MFLRKSKSHNKIYLSFVQGYRDEDGKVKQKTIEKLGYLEDLKLIYNDPIEHFKQIASQRNSEEIKELVIKNLNTKTLDIEEKQKNLNIDYNLNDIFSLLVFSRILYPSSKKETYKNKDIYFDKFNFSETDMYRSLDYFNQYKEELELLLWKNTKDKYNRDTTKTYYDCTNYYFEIEYNDEDKFDDKGNLIQPGYRKRGPEKNHRPDPIIEMGLLMDSSGLPIAYNLFPGNESEKLSLEPEINRLKNKFKFGRTIVVADRGLNCSDNIIKISGTSLEMSLKKNGYVYGQSVRGADQEFKDWVLSQDYITEIIEEDGKKVIFKHKSRIYVKVNIKMYKKLKIKMYKKCN